MGIAVFAVASDGTGAIFTGSRALQSGRLRSVSAAVVGEMPGVTTCFVHAFITKGGTDPGDAVQELFADYIEFNTGLNWDGSFAIDSDEIVVGTVQSDAATTIQFQIQVDLTGL